MIYFMKRCDLFVLLSLSLPELLQSGSIYLSVYRIDREMVLLWLYLSTQDLSL